MFIHNKRLQYTVRVGETNPVLASKGHIAAVVLLTKGSDEALIEQGKLIFSGAPAD